MRGQSASSDCTGYCKPRFHFARRYTFFQGDVRSATDFVLFQPESISLNPFYVPHHIPLRDSVDMVLEGRIDTVFAFRVSIGRESH